MIKRTRYLLAIVILAVGVFQGTSDQLAAQQSWESQQLLDAARLAERVLWSSDSSVAGSLNNLGSFYWSEAEYDRAARFSSVRLRFYLKV